MPRIGQVISHYEIVEELGSGGMGTVYRARDRRLGRDVAIKFLPPQLETDREISERFEREARAASALSHPNIAVVHDIGEFEGRSFLVMECVDGEDLGETLRRQERLVVEAALDVVIAVGEALAAAHRRGIVHRDVKPANVLILRDREGPRPRVKVIDFGVAKLEADAPLTQAGTALGTVAYMSPEQLRGESVDARADIWSLGVLLYECLTGRRPFVGSNPPALMQAILGQEPSPLDVSTSGSRAPLDAVVARALAKNPAERYDDMEQMLRDLRHLRAAEHDPTRALPVTVAAETAAGVLSASGSAAERPAARWLPATVLPAAVLPAVLLLAAVAAGTFGTWWWLSSSENVAPESSAATSDVIQLTQLTSSEELEQYPAFSPDGRRIAFSRQIDGYAQLVLRDLDSGTETQLTDGAQDSLQAAWTHDGGSLLFVRARRDHGKLLANDVFESSFGGDVWKRDLETGRETLLMEEAFHPTPSPDGEWFAFDADTRDGTRRIWKADLSGRRVRQLSFHDSEAVAHISPSWSPDGTRVVFQNVEKTKFDIGVLELASRSMRAVTDDADLDILPAWSPTGSAIYFSSYRSGGLNVWRVDVPADGGAFPEPRQVTTGAGEDVQIALSPRGDRLAFSVLNLNSDLWRLPVSPREGTASGPAEAVVSGTREESRGAWSPDATEIAFNSNRQGDMNLWIVGLKDGSLRQVTRGPGGDYQPNWSPDGRWLAFFSSRAGSADIWRVELATDEPRRLTEAPGLEMNPFVSPDGESIVYEADAGGRREIWWMRSDGTGQRQLTDVGAASHYVRWSTDGEFVYFRNRFPTDERNLWRVRVADGVQEPVASLEAGGWHISFNPDQTLVADNDHRSIWITELSTGEEKAIYSPSDPAVSLDYTVWSPDGRWILFDRLRKQGGDIWILDGLP